MTSSGGHSLSDSFLDLAAIKKLLDNEINVGNNNNGSSNCPSCSVPFGKGKKRRLIDQCGHERCYSCMFTNEACPLCYPAGAGESRMVQQNGNPSGVQTKRTLGNANLQGSEITLYGDIGSCNDNSRNKVKTNGHFTNYMQTRPNPGLIDAIGHPEKLPKTRPRNQRSDVMTQSCPTPPQSRRRYFLSPKALRSPFAQRVAQSRHQQQQQNSGDSAFSDDDCHSGSHHEKPKKSAEDMYMRLGLLLGDNATRSRPKRVQPTISSSVATPRSHESCSSLASYDTGAVLSSNTSPVSTLTGSSEDQRTNATVSDSVTSLMSMSMTMSMSSNCSNSSPINRRRHSVTNALDSPVLQSRRTNVRRSARNNGTVKGGPVDPKIRFAQYRAPQLTLKPLFFEVPQEEEETDPLFLGRRWLFKEMGEIVNHSSPGVLLNGNPGTGKTALILQLVEYSCFGRRKDLIYNEEIDSHERPISPQYCQIDSGVQEEKIRQLASRVVAYHFCQADNNNTCLVPDFIHSLAAQLCQSPQLIAYRDYLLSEPHLQGALSLRECIANSDQAFTMGILEPLSSLRRIGKIEAQNYVILVDGLCEAEYHKPDHGDTITSFLARHLPQIPAWLKILATVRTQLAEQTKPLPFTRISLDNINQNENLQRDLVDYINFRLKNSPSIQSNISTSNGIKIETVNQHKFAQHLLQLCRGSFLFIKMSLDLLERGHLVAKSSGFKVLPVSLAQIYLLHFNLRFPTIRSFEKVMPILSVCLAALYPLTLLEIYYSVNSLNVAEVIPWTEFLQRVKLLNGFLVKRLDNTYMFFHPSFREWLIRRDEDESTKFLCDLKTGHCAIAFRLSRVQAPLDSEKTLELGHHVLKGHVYKNMATESVTVRDLQSFWIAQASQNVSEGICNLRNVYSPNVKVSRLLLLSGSNPNYVTEFLGSAPILCLYANEGIVSMVDLLLEFGADVELSNTQGSTSLSLASAKGHIDVVNRLLQAGANPGHVDTAGHCPLVHAARNGRPDVVKLLLECNWSPGGHSEDNIEMPEAIQQALVAAAGQGHQEIVGFLLDQADIDVACSLTGETPLTIACTNGLSETVAILISKGADLSVANKKQLTPLLLAAKEGHLDVAQLLLKSSEIRTQSSEIRTQSSEIRVQNSSEILEQSDGQNRSPLMYAASEGHAEVVALLLEAGAELEKQDAEGLTALCWSCLRGKQSTVQMLLDKGALFNRNDKMGRTPLDLAAFQGNPHIVQTLLDSGALIEHVDLNGLRPLDRAISCKNIQVVQCFLKKGAKLGPATWAMGQGKPDILLILLNKLLEDGNLLYRKNRLREAAHRYQYALKKFPAEEENNQNFRQLKLNFLLNHSRCKRKLQDLDEAVDLANEALLIKNDSYEAYYAMAKAELDLGHYEKALADVKEALRFVPAQKNEVRKVLLHLREEIQQRQSNKKNISGNRDFAISLDTFHEC